MELTCFSSFLFQQRSNISKELSKLWLRSFLCEHMQNNNIITRKVTAGQNCFRLKQKDKVHEYKKSMWSNANKYIERLKTNFSNVPFTCGT